MVEGSSSVMNDYSVINDERGWLLCKPETQDDVISVYALMSYLCSGKNHHIDIIDIEKFSVHKVDLMLEELGYCVKNAEEDQINDEQQDTQQGPNLEKCNDKSEDDSEFIEDEDNNMTDPNIDMTDYLLNVDFEVEDYLNEKQHGEEDVLENEVVENEIEFGRFNENVVNFYLGQEFGTKEEAKNLTRKHSVESRRLIKVVKNDKARLRATCHGVLPEFEVNESEFFVYLNDKSDGNRDDGDPKQLFFSRESSGGYLQWHTAARSRCQSRVSENRFLGKKERGRTEEKTEEAMDPKLTEVSQLFERLKAALIRNDFDTCSRLLSQLKILLIEFKSLPPLFAETPNAIQELTLARDIYEHAVVLSVKMEDQDAFERDFFQLKPYYTDVGGRLPQSPQEYPILGLNLLRLLVQNRIAEFHTELELLSANALENPCIKHAVELEQSFMEGAYNRVLTARQTVPHESYVYFMDLLARTVRDEIAGCSEKAYDSLRVEDARQMLLLSSDQELFDYIKEEHPEWEVKNGWLVFNKVKESSASSKEIPSLQLINQTLSYARELERIV
ncbi:hypothetical protein E3N88_20272 [Mikania micrantha]|uniref:PCI domain-containing protein n=1 Tax=Mikania micrantha TaxID=192012 RepID=A0A5N6NHQ3_9ASTR|nr:hypothetical protein E3N88_20272 [Mikania micrantha]